jgi:hypothetical protein
MAEWMLHVDVPWACFGIVADEEGVVISAAPIAGWAVGRRAREVEAYWRGRGARLLWRRLSP